MDVDTLEAHPVHIKVSNVKSLANVLQAIKYSAKQACTMILTEDSMNIGWEEDSKTLQSSIYLKSGCFSHFHCPAPRRVIGLQYNLLVDTLAVFSCNAEATMDLRYPGADGQIVCEMLETYDSVTVSSYAHINSIEQLPARDLGSFWEEPVTAFLVPVQLIREAVEDLEWTGGPIALHVKRHPQQIALSSSGNGDMEVLLPMSEVLGFSCPSPEARFAYKYKSLRLAFSNIPKEAAIISTKVAIDARGMLKVTHMMDMGGAAAAAAASDMLETQRMYDSTRGAVVTFTMLPIDDEVDDQEGAAAATAA